MIQSARRCMIRPAPCHLRQYLDGPGLRGHNSESTTTVDRIPPLSSNGANCSHRFVVVCRQLYAHVDCSDWANDRYGAGLDMKTSLVNGNSHHRWAGQIGCAGSPYGLRHPDRERQPKSARKARRLQFGHTPPCACRSVEISGSAELPKRQNVLVHRERPHAGGGVLESQSFALH